MTPNDVKIVADNIDDFIEVPDGIERLRSAVLTLAVAGKLVIQDIKEGTAEELHKVIQKERAEEVTNRRRRDSGVNPVTPEEASFEIPKSWMWVRLGDIVRIDNGYAFKSSKYVESGVRVIRITNVQDGFIADNNPKFISDADNKEFSDFQLYEDDLLMSLTGYVGRVAMFPSTMLPAVLNQRVARIVPSINGLKPYIFTYLKSGVFRAIAASSTRGMAQQNMSTEWLKTHPIPMPPLSEQKRIVRKVEEVMRQLDELEAKKLECDKVRTRLARSAMYSLGKGDSRIAFEELTELVKTPSDIKELENALLTLAVSGKLVAQDKKDTAVESKRATTEYGKEFNIPKSWAWFRLNDVCTFKYGYTDSAKETGTARFVRITDMGSDGNLIPDDQRYVDLSPESKKYLLSEGDLLTARIGATFGRTIIFREKYKAVFASYLIRMSFEKDFILPEYYWVFSQSGLYWNQAHSLVSGSAQPQFNANLIKKIYLPVPPLAEQKRIVKKVEEVMDLINRLKQVIGEK